MLFDNSADYFLFLHAPLRIVDVHNQRHPLDAEFFSMVLLVAGLAIGKPLIGFRKRLRLPVGMAAEPQRQAMAVPQKSGGEVHQILQDGFQPAPLLCPAGLFLIHQANLADGAQVIVSQPGAGHHQGVCGELSGWQPLQIEIGFKF